MPYPRTGQGGEPHLTLPDAITGNLGDQGCGPPGLPLPGPTGCYPYREPLPRPPPGGPPPGRPPSRRPDLQSIPSRRRAGVRAAPGEAPPISPEVNRDREADVPHSSWRPRSSLVMVAGVIVAVRATSQAARTMVVGYFDNSTAAVPRRRRAHPRRAGGQGRQD